MIRRISKKRAENRNSIRRNIRNPRFEGVSRSRFASNSRRHRKNESLAGYEGSVYYEDFRSFFFPSSMEVLIDKKTGKETRRGEGLDDIFECCMDYDTAYDVIKQYDALFEGDYEPRPLTYDDILEDDWSGDQFSETFKECMNAIPCSSNQSLWWVADDVVNGIPTNLAIEEAWCQAEVDDLCPRVGDRTRRDPFDTFHIEDDTISIQIGYNSMASVHAVVEADVAWEMGLFEDDSRIQKLIRHISNMNPKAVWNDGVAKDLIKKYLPCYNMKSIGYCYILYALEYVEAGGDYDSNMHEFCYQMQADPFYSILDMVYLGYK